MRGAFRLHINEIEILFDSDKLRLLSAKHAERLESGQPFILEAKPDITTIELVCACWHSGIPFLMAPPGLNETTKRLLEERIRASTNPPALWLQTSGSTQAPKLVRLTRGNIEAAAKASGPLLKPQPGKSWLLNLPLHHAGGMGILLRCLLWGSAVRLASGNDTESIASALKSSPEIDTVSLVPIQLRRLIDSGHADLLVPLKTILIGGGGLSDADTEAVNRLRLPVRQSYGMTETFGHFCLGENASETPAMAGYAGKPLPGNEIEIRGENGLVCTDGQSGQVWIRGPQVFGGYEPPALAEIDPEGWFNTGDFGRLSSDGAFIYEARRTDLIKTGGESVNPSRVEAAINSLGLFADVAVVGIPDPEWGQRVHACLVAGGSIQISLDKLRELLRNQLQAWELPKSLSWHDTLPRTALGKLRQGDLRME